MLWICSIVIVLFSYWKYLGSSGTDIHSDTVWLLSFVPTPKDSLFLPLSFQFEVCVFYVILFFDLVVALGHLGKGVILGVVNLASAEIEVVFLECLSSFSGIFFNVLYEYSYHLVYSYGKIFLIFKLISVIHCFIQELCCSIK